MPSLENDDARLGVPRDEGRAVGAIYLAVLVPYLGGNDAGRGVAHDGLHCSPRVAG